MSIFPRQYAAMNQLVYLLVLGLIFLVLLILDATRSRTGLPGPRGVPLLGMGLELAFKPLRDLFPWLTELIKNHGATFEVNICGFRTVIMTDPAEIERLLSSINYIEKGREYFILKPWLREGLLLSSGDKWHQRRKLLTPTFHFKILEDSISRHANSADKFVEKLLETKGQPLQVEDLVRASTLQIICETALGINMTTADEEKTEYVSAINRLTEDATEWFIHFWLHAKIIFRLSPLGRSYYRNLSVVHAFSKRVIQYRKRSFLLDRQKVAAENKEVRRLAFLDRLLELDAEWKLSNEDIQEEVDTFTFEGHDTTSAALIFALYLLANHTEVQERAANEQYKIFGSDKRQPNMKDLHEMCYLEMIIKETLRLYPSVPVISRKLSADLVLTSGIIVPAGSTVMVLSYFTHRNKLYWDKPEEFRPERFGPSETRHPFCYIPFSAGPRNCVGQKFAMMEMKMILSAVLRRCHLQANTTKIRLLPNIILKNENPIILNVFPRKLK